jgi:hypothetical protein
VRKFRLRIFSQHPLKPALLYVRSKSRHIFAKCYYLSVFSLLETLLCPDAPSKQTSRLAKDLWNFNTTCQASFGFWRQEFQYYHTDFTGFSRHSCINISQQKTIACNQALKRMFSTRTYVPLLQAICLRHLEFSSQMPFSHSEILPIFCSHFNVSDTFTSASVMAASRHTCSNVNAFPLHFNFNVPIKSFIQ